MKSTFVVVLPVLQAIDCPGWAFIGPPDVLLQGLSLRLVEMSRASPYPLCSWKNSLTK